MSVVIFSVGMLAVAALQLIAKRNNIEAGQRSLAAQLAYDIIERMRANSSTVALNAYVQSASPYPSVWIGRARLSASTPDPGCSSTSRCTGASMALGDLLIWEHALDGQAEQLRGQWVGGLPYPTACVGGPAAGGSGVYTVTIAWRGSLPMPDNPSVSCGRKAVGTGAAAPELPLYGDSDEYRRSVSVSAYITARV